MIKIEIEINEREIKELGNKIIKSVEVKTVEKRIKCTKGEMEVANMLEKRLKLDRNIGVIDKTKNQKTNEEKIEEILKELFK